MAMKLAALTSAWNKPYFFTAAFAALGFSVSFTHSKVADFVMTLCGIVVAGLPRGRFHSALGKGKKLLESAVVGWVRPA